MKCILSLDSGGIRCLASLVFLAELEKNLGSTIFEKFDFFVGTSTGGIASAGFVYGQQLAQDIIDWSFNYESLNVLMGSSWWDRTVGLAQGQPKFDAAGKTSYLKSMFAPDPTVPLVTMDQIPEGKRCMVTAYDVERRKPTFYKSWQPTSTTGQYVSIVGALDQSFAAPCYYPTVYEENVEIWGVDGAVFADNPSESAYVEGIKFWGKEEDIRILSVGTGTSIRPVSGVASQEWGPMGWITEGYLMNIFMESQNELCHYRMQTLTEALGHQYSRVNLPLENVSDDFDEVTRGNMKNITAFGAELWETYGAEVLAMLAE